MDGETVDVQESFSNGLDYPGDPSGDASETAGCTCAVDVIVTDAAEGDGYGGDGEGDGGGEVAQGPTITGDELWKTADGVVPDLSYDEIDAVNRTWFMGSVAKRTSKYMRTGDAGYGEARLAADIKTMESLIERAAPLAQDTTVYRTVANIGEDGKRVIPDVGGEFTDNSFVATTADSTLSFGGGTTYEIRLPEGTKALKGVPELRGGGGDDNERSRLRRQQQESTAFKEYVLAPGTKFRVMPDNVLEIIP
jgi:hypothetical protein